MRNTSRAFLFVGIPIYWVILAIVLIVEIPFRISSELMNAILSQFPHFSNALNNTMNGITNRLSVYLYYFVGISFWTLVVTSPVWVIILIRRARRSGIRSLI